MSSASNLSTIERFKVDMASVTLDYPPTPNNHEKCRPFMQLRTMLCIEVSRAHDCQRVD